MSEYRQSCEHRYPRAVLLADLLRGVGGLLLCALLMSFAQAAGWLAIMLATAMALFAIHVFAEVKRCRQRFEADSDSLRMFNTAKSDVAFTRLDWNELDRLDLQYFSTRRDGRGGWLQLRLRAGKRRVRLDSRLSGFESLLARAVAAARARGVALSATTAGNLAAIGFDADRLEQRNVDFQGRHEPCPGDGLAAGTADSSR